MPTTHIITTLILLLIMLPSVSTFVSPPSLNHIAHQGRRRQAAALTPLRSLPDLSSPLLSLASLNAVVLVHEAGHYLAARLIGVNVTEFSVGVGPALLRREGPRGGTTFSLRALPLGGYVSFPDAYNKTLFLEQLEVS